MTVLYILAEGPSERGFCEQVLVPHLESVGIWCIPRVWFTNRRLGARGGGGWCHLRDELRRMMRDSRKELRYSTFLDLYGLPSDFPGRDEARAIEDPVEKARFLEAQMEETIGDSRLIPYIQVHEFEALVFTDLMELDTLIDGRTAALRRLKKDIKGLQPEEIDELPNTHPSKRLEDALGTAYQKSLHGPQVLQRIGLHRIRAACPHFDDWLTTMEHLSTTGEA